MAIASIAIHRLTRFQDDQPGQLTLTETPLTVTADYEALFSQLKKVFQFKTGKLLGKFTENIGEAPFQGWLKDNQEGKSPFIKLTQLYAERFKTLADLTAETFEYFICCIQEERADGDRMYVFFLETSAGLSINSDLSLDTVEPLNTSKLDLAIRIELAELSSIYSGTNTEESDETPYLCMIKSRGTGKLGDAFAQSFGFISNIDSNKETETLMALLANYTKDEAPQEGAKVRQKAYEFCVDQHQLGEAVPLNELSGFLDENQPTRFAEFANENAQLESQQNLHPDTRKLKHLVRISGKGNGLSLSFSSDLMQETILFDEKHDTLTITAIPKSLKKQILEHLKEQEDS